jgi:methenyltetrahydrofolate cyclohydrolase
VTVLTGSGLGGTSLTAFAEALASAAPTPGGSCAAALPAGLAAGLVAMVARLSAESDPFSDASFDLEAVAGEADRLREQLLGLLDDDAAAFEQVMAARRRPEEAAAQDAYRAAVEPPVEVCRRSLRVLELAALVMERGNPNAAADAGVSVLLAAASVEAAALNAELELGPIDDEVFRSVRSRELRDVRARAARLRESALAAVSPRRD